jgi:hypothetical protein
MEVGTVKEEGILLLGGTDLSTIFTIIEGFQPIAQEDRWRWRV